MERPPLSSFVRPALKNFVESPIQLRDLELKPLLEKIQKRIEKSEKRIEQVANKDIDISEITERVVNILPAKPPKVIKGIDGVDGKNATDVTPKELIEKINKSRTGKIKRDRVEGFDEIEGMVRGQARQIQNVISLGGSRQTAIKVSGTLLGTGINTVNFVGATGAKVGDGSEVNVTITPAASSSYQSPTSGIVNGTNQTFTWAVAPNVIAVDGGRTMQKVSSNSTVNWTGTTTTVLTIAPTFDIYSLA